MKNILRKGSSVVRRAIFRLKNFGKTEILVLGDSHADVLSHSDASIAGYVFRIVRVGGATISGLKNPNSVTQAMPIFRKAIKSYKGKLCVILLGEVDTGFVIWLRAKKHGLNVQELCEQTAANYIDFIRSIPKEKQVIIISAPLPTIQDGQIANLRKEVDASLIDRTKLTVTLNSRMESLAKKFAILYLNLDSNSLGEDETVKRELLHSDANNHHYDPKTYLKILMPPLREIVEQVGAGNVAPRRA